MPATRVYRLLRDGGMRVDENNIWELRVTYMVTGPSSQFDVYGAVDSTSGLPLPVKGSGHPENPLLVVQNFDAKWVDQNDVDGDFWECPVVWRSAAAVVFPVDDPTEWQWDQTISSEQFDCDRDGNPLVNSASDPLEGTIADDVILPSIRIWRTLPLYDPALAFTVANALNESPMTIFGTWSIEKEQMRCLYSKPVGKQRLGGAGVRVESAFEFRNQYRGHQPRTIDAGGQGWWASDKRGRFYADGDKDPWPVPLFLDGTGVPISEIYMVGVSEGDTVTTYDPVANPSVPDWFEVVPDSPTGGKMLIYTRKRTYNFVNFAPPVM